LSKQLEEESLVHRPATTTLKRGVRPTLASRGHTKKPAPAPTEAETFTIPRFRNVNHYAIDDKW
jgi:hypothetical protein